MDDKYLLNGWCRHGVPFDACRLCAANHVESGPTSTNKPRDETVRCGIKLQECYSYCSDHCKRDVCEYQERTASPVG